MSPDPYANRPRSAGATRPVLYIALPAVSPDGRFIVMQRVKRPYSYWVRYREFSVSVEIWDRQGRLVRTMADLPSTDQVTAPGKRRRNLTGLESQAHKPATRGGERF